MSSLTLPVDLIHDFTREAFEGLMVSLSDMAVSDITIKTGMPIMVKLHGHQQPAIRRALQDNELRKILGWMYGDNATTEIGRQTVLDKRYEINVGNGKRVAFRMNAVGCLAYRGAGQHITLRAMPRELPKLVDMAIPNEMVKEFIAGGTGLFAVVGSTGSGKSTLLAALVGHVNANAQDRKIVTFESPIEFDMSALKSDSNIIVQSEIGQAGDLASFQDAVRAALRQGPTDILIGEARDRETINEMMHAAETGHATYCTVHAESVRTTFARIAQVYPTEAFSQIIFMLVSLMRVVVCQRLSIPVTTGRRVPIREWLVIDAELRKRLSRMTAMDALNEIESEVQRRGQSFAQQARLVYDAGKITASELAKYIGDEAIGLPEVAL